MVGAPATVRIFARVLCGVDETPESLASVRQAVRVTEPDGTLDVVAAFDEGRAAQAGWVATKAAAQLRADAEEALAAARREAPDASFRAISGRPADVLLAEARRLEATLVAVGSHGRRRAAGIALGGVATTILHEAPCSVLVAREPTGAGEFPRSVVVGIDGSPESAAAYSVAVGLGERFGPDVRPVASTRGKRIDADAVRAIAADVVLDERRPVDALVTAAEKSGLLVVGSRGLHGVRALGSVSERVAHQAGCSVLVVRTQGGPDGAP